MSNQELAVSLINGLDFWKGLLSSLSSSSSSWSSSSSSGSSFFQWPDFPKVVGYFWAMFTVWEDKNLAKNFTLEKEKQL